jgi:phosphoribosylamine--glycine ligase
MKIFIVGSGGREHALAWKCAQTADEVLVAPGNAGTAREDKVRNVPVSSDDIDGLLELAKSEKVDARTRKK